MAKAELIDTFGFKEVLMRIAPERITNIGSNTQMIRVQYGMRSLFSSTVHSAQGETYPSVAICLSEQNKYFKLWDKGQLVANTNILW